jgi:hypothetical protein
MNNNTSNYAMRPRSTMVRYVPPAWKTTVNTKKVGLPLKPNRVQLQRMKRKLHSLKQRKKIRSAPARRKKKIEQQKGEGGEEEEEKAKAVSATAPVCALASAERTTLRQLITGICTNMPTGWSPETKRDATALAMHFAATFSTGCMQDAMRAADQNKVTVLMLHNSHLSDEYERIASQFECTKVPLLNRSSAAPPSFDLRVRMAESSGLATEKLGFHGTYNENVASICNTGFLTPSNGGQRGNAIYTANNACYSRTYARGSHATFDDKIHQMFGCRVLAFAGELFREIFAVKDANRTLPLLVFQFPDDLK